MVIESPLSVIWDITKTKRYPQEITIYLIRKKNRDSSHMTESGGKERGSVKFWFILYFWSKCIIFFKLELEV